MEPSSLQFILFAIFSTALIWALVSHYGRDLWGLVGSTRAQGGVPGDGVARGQPATDRLGKRISATDARPPLYVAPVVVTDTPSTTRAARVVHSDRPGRAGLSRGEILQTIEAIGGAVGRLRPVLARIQSKRDLGQAVAVDDISVSALDDLAALKVGCGKLGEGANTDRFALLGDDVAQFHEALLRLVGLARSAPLEGSWTDPVAATLEELLARVGVAMSGIESRMRAEAGVGR